MTWDFTRKYKLGTVGESVFPASSRSDLGRETVRVMFWNVVCSLDLLSSAQSDRWILFHILIETLCPVWLEDQL